MGRFGEQHVGCVKSNYTLSERAHQKEKRKGVENV
jgi:hypothetical protein